MSYNTKNYTEQGGAVTHIGGALQFDEGACITGFPGAQNMPAETPGSDSVAKVRTSLNDLITRLKTAGVMIPDAWNASALVCPTPAAMPTAETAANSGHATVSIEGTEITIALDGKVADLVEADHGQPWGRHRWLGFGVRTGLTSIVGVKFTDDTGASATLGEDDAAEATALGLSAGDFVLYIKADQEAYLTGDRSFTLQADGFAMTTFTMKIVEGGEA